MIGYIEGKILRVEEKELIVLAGSIGYRVVVTSRALAAVDKDSDVQLYTYLAVRDDALDLYGFHDANEEQLFRLLLKVSGIGPKTAMNILGAAGPELLVRAISSQDSSYLTKVSGVGKKVAEKIVLELRDKVVGSDALSGNNTAESEALDALESLGYSIRDTRDIVRSIAAKLSDASEIVREALKQLGKKQ